MGLPLGDIKLSANFELNISKPIDSRMVVNDLVERDSISFKYAGMIIWVVSESKHFKLLDDNITWEEFGGISSATVGDLKDVNISSSSVNDGQSLVYDSASTSWVNRFVGLQNNSKMLNPLVTSGNNANTGIAIVNKPLGDVIVVVNGVVVEVSFGSVLGKCYFADPLNLNIARIYQNVLPNDVLVWNGLVTGYDLDNTDEVSFYYES
jgi:hypothetical protein